MVLKNVQVRMPYLLSNQSTVTASSLPSPVQASRGFSTAGQSFLHFIFSPFPKLTVFYRSENILADKTEEDNSSERQSLLTSPEENLRPSKSVLSSREPLDQVGGGRTTIIEEEPDESVKLL